ncbi:MAG: 50S ribosomal protein L9 [Rickettsiaceae bacterium]|nr:50S ribosomal protein L9 [Rickettsiaceae bacterium]
MKVVLLKPRKKLGNIGDIVEVKDGFGRNFLIPQKIASRATKQNLEFFEAKKHELEAQNDKYLAECKKIASDIEGKDFTFISQSSDDGRLFGSVNAKDIASNISENHGVKIDQTKVALEIPLKSLGIFEVLLQLHVDVSAKILVNIARSENEARDALKNFRAAAAKTESVENTEVTSEEVIPDPKLN